MDGQPGCSFASLPRGDGEHPIPYPQLCKRTEGVETMRNVSRLQVALMFFCVSLPGAAQDARQIVQQAVDTEISANHSDRSRWMFKEVDKQPGKGVVQWVAQTSAGEVKRVMVRNGQKVPAEQQRSEASTVVTNAGERSKQQKAGAKDDKQAETFMRQFPVGFQWEVVSRSGDSIKLHYKPDPNYNPPTREARVLAAMEGDMVVHATQHRIMSLDGHLTDDVTFGFGVFGRLFKGGSFSVKREELAPGVWQIVRSTTNIKGHALIFKSISEQEDDTKSSFERLPDDTSLEKALDMVMAKPE